MWFRVQGGEVGAGPGLCFAAVQVPTNLGIHVQASGTSLNLQTPSPKSIP